MWGGGALRRPGPGSASSKTIVGAFKWHKPEQILSWQDPFKSPSVAWKSEKEDSTDPGGLSPPASLSLSRTLFRYQSPCEMLAQAGLGTLPPQQYPPWTAGGGSHAVSWLQMLGWEGGMPTLRRWSTRWCCQEGV